MAASSYSNLHKRIKWSLKNISSEECDILPIIQPISISTEDDDDLRLIELDPEILKYVESGNSLTIRGEEKAPAVICTNSQTYEMKVAETSSPLSIVSGMLWPDECDKASDEAEKNLSPHELLGVFRTYYEIIPCAPRLKKLYMLLGQCPYQGKVYEEPSIQKYTMKELLGLVQASNEELQNALNAVHACEIDGHVRILDCEYKFDVVSRIVGVAESESLPFGKVPKEYTISLLQDLYAREILEHCFLWYASDTGVKQDGDPLYAFKQDEICRLYAEIILKPFTKFNLQDFLESWQGSVPNGMTTDISLLQGLALVDTTSKPKVISYFPIKNLPDDFEERLSVLFKAKARWSYEDILPYVRDQGTSNMSVKALLIKHCRSFMNEGTEMFCSKWYSARN